MAFYKNIASQKIAVFAYDSTDGSAKTGDAANISAQISLDGAATAATNDVAPTELDATDAPGIYLFDMTQAESNADLISLTPVSATSNILLEPVIIYTTPGDGTALAADTIEWLGTAAATPTTAGVPEVDVTFWTGTAATLSSITNKPEVDVNSVSDDAATAGNLETVYGGIKGHYPSYQGPRGPGIYLNDAAGNTNTSDGVDGTINNPVSTIGAAKTLADSLSIDRIYLVNDSGVTLAATMTDYEFVGIGSPEGNTIALGSQDISGSAFYNLTISGVQTGTGRALFEDCIIGTATLHLDARRCGFTDSVTGVTFSSNDDNILDQCFSMVPGNATPIFICSGANLDLSVRHYSGGIEIKTASASMTATLEFVAGQVIFNADCNTAAAITLRGMYSKTDNATMASLTETAGWPYILDDDTNAYDRTAHSLREIVERGNAAWITGGGTGLTALTSGTAQSGTASTIVLAAVTNFADDILNGAVINILTGTGAGQSRMISDWTQSSDTATITPNWTTNPDATSAYEVVNGSVNTVLISGAAPEDSADLADAVWLELLAAHSGTAGSAAEALAAAGTAGDPWVTALPGAYGAGTAGKIVGDNIDAAVSSRSAASVLGAAVGADISADIAAVKSVADGIPTTAMRGTDSAALASALGNPVGADISADLAGVKSVVDGIPTTAMRGTDNAATATALNTHDGKLDGVVADLPVKLTKNTAFTNFMFKMVDATNGYTAETGISVTATRSLDGAAFGACANAAVEVASGWYKIDLDAADLNGDMVVLAFNGTGCRATEVMVVTQAT